ncbi:MerR family transcriptional regulator [Rubneribacter badeniensis]|uniref:MerR family transcriptional regulator n=1 Tax=Rubneribacter badeniensis TaxID=2070688 RepID=A0A2K2U6E6_9ACTN|nr:MerR family transcriptional regulator [Rubneribacter badeniensis]OUO93168.1 MerR family transcriptional regulator [Gordonibacter sp. An232A]PNV65812.1 MerR family transcriptional regulator [Rubneribacter badeniensis]CVH76738.1 HTH-type transcriptional regulator AdhR [Coriobacteriaceae bacterium CHKCI002]HJH42319.1 MerR family transcriptional regulator [Rubneribacter badeniensis]
MKIAEVSKEYGLSADTLRYYERIGLLPNVTRTPSGIRDYSEQDCARVQFVKCMRAANVSIEALIEYMALFEQGDSTIEARKAILEEQRDLVRERIAEMQAGLDRLNYKIDNYETMLAKEREMRGEARA